MSEPGAETGNRPLAQPEYLLRGRSPTRRLVSTKRYLGFQQAVTVNLRATYVRTHSAESTERKHFDAHERARPR